MNPTLYYVLLCGVYMFIGPTLIILNKYILSDLNFPYPIFLSALGVFVTVLVSNLSVNLGFVKLQKKEQVEGRFYYTKILPIGLGQAGTLAFGNVVYLFLNVGTIQMLKSFTPVIIFLTSYMYYNFACFNNINGALAEKCDYGTLVSLLVISVGTAATCGSTPELSFVGLFMMLMAEFMESLRLIITQHLLQNLKFDVFETQYHISPASGFWLLICSAIFEFKDMYQNNALSIIFEHFFTFLCASSLGLFINYLAYYVIQATSSLTMKVLGTLRNIITIFVGVLFFGEVVTTRELIGYSVALVGFFLYNAAKAGILDKYLKPTSKSVSSSSISSMSTTAYERLNTMDIDPESSPRVTNSYLSPVKVTEMSNLNEDNQTDSPNSPAAHVTNSSPTMPSANSTSVKRFAYKV